MWRRKFSNPRTTASSSISSIAYLVQVSDKNLQAKPIGFNCSTVFLSLPDNFYWQLSLSFYRFLRCSVLPSMVFPLCILWNCEKILFVFFFVPIHSFSFFNIFHKISEFVETFSKFFYTHCIATAKNIHFFIFRKFMRPIGPAVVFFLINLFWYLPVGFRFWKIRVSLGQSVSSVF